MEIGGRYRTGLGAYQRCSSKDNFQLLLVMLLKLFQMYCGHRLLLGLWQGTHWEKSISLSELEDDFSQVKSHPGSVGRHVHRSENKD